MLGAEGGALRKRAKVKRNAHVRGTAGYDVAALRQNNNTKATLLNSGH